MGWEPKNKKQIKKRKKEKKNNGISLYHVHIFGRSIKVIGFLHGNCKMLIRHHNCTLRITDIIYMCICIILYNSPLVIPNFHF